MTADDPQPARTDDDADALAAGEAGTTDGEAGTAAEAEPGTATDAGTAAARSALAHPGPDDGRATRLVLVRHGHARSADERVVAGHAGCRGLSDLGRRQAEALRDRLAVQRFRPDAVVTSLLPRAVETAEIVAEGLVDDPSAIPRDCDLCERHPGDADGWSWEELAARHGGVDPVRHPDRPPAPGGESGRAMRQRVVATVAQLSHRYPGRTVLVVTHAGVILHATLHLLGLGPRWFAHDLANTSVTEWVRDGEGRWLLGRFNDAAHLEALGA